jgi:hypothetical protein
VEIPVFKAERDAGLDKLVRSSVGIAYMSEVRLSQKFELSEKVIAKLKEKAKAAKADFDLHYVDTILATTCWNRNDDVFETVETWLARHTPEHKPFNYEHDCSNIIGHIVSNCVMNADGEAVPDDTIVEDLPSKFHILTGAVLYKRWDKPELQEQMDALLEEIAKGNYGVSMECLFQGFDYATRTKNGQHKIVARNEQTAFLTKHLRAYGGPGIYQDQKIGRLMRNITFSGKGLVKRPANPESVILPEGETFSAKSGVLTEQVYLPPTEIIRETENTMAVEIELQKQLDAMKIENEKLHATIHANDVSGHKAQAEKAIADKAKADEIINAANIKLNQFSDEIEASNKAFAELQVKLTEAEKSLADTSEELKNIYAGQKLSERLAKVKAAMKVNEADAEAVKKAVEFNTSVSGLSDEQFTSVVASVSMMTMPPATNNPQTGTLPAAPFKASPTAPPKSTSAPTAPKSTSMPVGNKAAEVEGSIELEVEPVVDASLATQVVDSGVSDVQKAIATYFGVKAESDNE